MSAILLDARGVPEEGRLLVPHFARSVIPKRQLSLPEFEALFPRMMGGAGQNTFPLEGLDNTLNSVTTQTWYMRLFTSQTATTVPSDDSVLTGSASAPYTTGTSLPVEVPAAAGYAAVSMAPAVWGANTTIAAKGRKSTASQQSFPQSTGSWGTINGYFLATTAASTGQNTGVALMYANFSDGLGVAINGAGYTLQITPYLELDSSQ